MKVLATILIVTSSIFLISSIYSKVLCTYSDDIFYSHFSEDGSLHHYGHLFFFVTFISLIVIPIIVGWGAYKNLNTEKANATMLIVVAIIAIIFSVGFSLPYIECGWGLTSFAINNWWRFY